MKRILVVLCVAVCGAGMVHAYILDEEIFARQPSDPLAPRDEWGLLHQMPALTAVETAPRYGMRAAYYFKAGEQLVRQSAYVAAVQRDLKRLGYYCGPIDGFFSAEVSDAIARLQKNSSMPVTGTLTESVRRALRLP